MSDQTEPRQHPHLSPAELKEIHTEVSKQLQPIEDDKRRAQVRLRLHMFALIAAGFITTAMVVLKVDEHSALAFSFGPLGPSIIQETLDFFKRL